jgi:ATP-dependent helicase/DNAse subunit B
MGSISKGLKTKQNGKVCVFECNAEHENSKYVAISTAEVRTGINNNYKEFKKHAMETRELYDFVKNLDEKNAYIRNFIRLYEEGKTYEASEYLDYEGMKKRYKF